MNLAGDGLMLVIALHELGDREDAYLNASPDNFPSSGAFLAPPARQSPKERVALRSFTGSTPMNSGASSQGWLTQKRSADQNHRPARRTVPSCTRRAGRLANRGVAPGGLAGAAETRTRQAIKAPTFFGKARAEFSTVPLRTGLRPVEAPFHETSVTGLRPVVQDCSAATLGPAANAGASSDALDSLGNARALPHALHSVELARGAGLRLVAATRPSTLCACRRCSPRGWLRRKRSADQNHRPARRTVPSCTRRAGLLASGTRPALPRPFPRFPDLSRWTTPSHGATIAPPTHRGARMGEYITSSSAEHADGIGLMAPSSLLTCDPRQTPWLLPNKGLHPTRAARGRVKPRSLGGRSGCANLVAVVAGSPCLHYVSLVPTDWLFKWTLQLDWRVIYDS
jgi:hypothetical protein